MKLKNLLLAIFSLITVTLYSQNTETKVEPTNKAVTGFELKTDKIEELRDFDWNTINELFETNEQDQIIKLEFEYENNSKKRNSKPSIKELKFEVSGTTEELPDLIEKSKRMVSKFLEINETYK